MLLRKEAFKLGLKRYFTGKPCKHGHICERFVSSRECVICTENRRKIRDIEFPEKKRLTSKNWCLAHPERVKSNKIEWFKNNPKKRKEAIRKYSKSFKGRAKKASLEAKREALKINATPIWLTAGHFLEIEGYYQLAKVMGIITGEKFHVDHIHPLRGKKFNGLHVPWNLQVITAKENCAKKNNLEEG